MKSEEAQIINGQPVRGKGSLKDARPSPYVPPTYIGEATLAGLLRNGEVLAQVPAGSEREIRVIRLPSGEITLGDFQLKSCGMVGGRILREWTLPPAGLGIVIGTLKDLTSLGQAITALTRSLGPNEGEGG